MLLRAINYHVVLHLATKKEKYHSNKQYNNIAQS